MTIFIAMMVWVVVVGYMSRSSEETVPAIGGSEKRTNYTYALLIFSLIIILCGLRDDYGDTRAYYKGFESAPSEIAFIKEYLDANQENPIYFLLVALIKCFVSDDPVIYLFIITLISAIAVMVPFRRYSPNFPLTVFLFIASTKVTWLMNGIKQFLAAAIIFFLIDCVAEKKWFKYFLAVALAYFIHPSSIVALPVYFVAQGKPWSKKILLFIGASLLAITFLDSFTSFMDSALEGSVYESGTSKFSTSAGSSIMRAVIAAVPAVFAFIKRKQIEKIATPFINVCINLSVITTGIYLIASFTNGITMGRVPIYFELSSFILLPWLIERTCGEGQRALIKSCCIAAYLVYFYFASSGTFYHSTVLGISIY